MGISEIAYRFQVLFHQKVTSAFHLSFKGEFGRVQMETLCFLQEHSLVRGQELSQSLNIPKQHVSKIMGRLEELGLVVHQVDSRDNRFCLYSLSDQGKKMMAERIGESNRSFESRLSRLSQEDQDRFQSAMETLVEVLEKL